MNPWFRKTVSTALCLAILLPPALMAAPVEPTASPTAAATPGKKPTVAPSAQVRLLDRLSKLELFSALAPFAEIKKPTDQDVTDALVSLYPAVSKTDEARWREAGVSEGDGGELLALVQAKKGALRAKGLSAWAYEKKLQRLTVQPAGEPAPQASPTATATGADAVDVKALRERVQNLEERAEAIQRTEKDLQAERDKVQTLQGQVDRMQGETALRAKAAEDAEKARTSDRESQREEARLLKGLVEDLQAGQKRLEASLAAVDKKADEKGITDEELSQSLSIMRKDLRDNVQDVSVLKQKVERLMAPEKTYARPLDKVLASKWVPGAALLIAIGAVVVAASKK